MPPDPPEKGADFSKVKAKETTKDKELAAMEKRAEDLAQKLNEERFLWCVAILILFNVMFFALIDNWGGPIALALIEGIFLVILAKRFKVGIAIEFIDKVLNSAGIPKRESHDKD